MKRLVGSILIVALTLGLGVFREAGATPETDLRKQEAERKARAEAAAKRMKEPPGPPFIRVDSGPLDLDLLSVFHTSHVYHPASPSRDDSADIPKDMDRIIMTNHDRLTGTLTTIKDGLVSIKSTHVEEEIKVPLKNATRIYFRKPASNLSPGWDQVLFPNGESLSGNLVSLNDREIVLETQYASTLKIRRRLVKGIILGGGYRVLLADDFSKLSDKWKVHSGTWKVKDGKLFQDQHGSYRFISPHPSAIVRPPLWDLRHRCRNLLATWNCVGKCLKTPLFGVGKCGKTLQAP